MRRRGGVAYVDEWAVNLAPPGRRAAFLHVSRSDDGFASIECGFTLKTAAVFVDFENVPHSALSVVEAIMDGHASEYADATADGTWIGTRYLIPLPDGSQGSGAPARRRGEERAVRSFQRRIPAWTASEDSLAGPDDEADDGPVEGSIRFLSYEEAVRMGVMDPDPDG